MLGVKLLLLLQLLSGSLVTARPVEGDAKTSLETARRQARFGDFSFLCRLMCESVEEEESDPASDCDLFDYQFDGAYLCEEICESVDEADTTKKPKVTTTKAPSGGSGGNTNGVTPSKKNPPKEIKDSSSASPSNTPVLSTPPQTQNASSPKPSTINSTSTSESVTSPLTPSSDSATTMQPLIIEPSTIEMASSTEPIADPITPSPSNEMPEPPPEPSPSVPPDSDVVPLGASAVPSDSETLNTPTSDNSDASLVTNNTQGKEETTSIAGNETGPNNTNAIVLDDTTITTTEAETNLDDVSGGRGTEDLEGDVDAAASSNEVVVVNTDPQMSSESDLLLNSSSSESSMEQTISKVGSKGQKYNGTKKPPRTPAPDFTPTTTVKPTPVGF